VNRLARPRIGPFSLGFALLLWATSAKSGVVVRGDKAALDETKLEMLVRLELGDASAVDEVIVDVANGRATISVERRSGTSRTGVIALPASGSGELERTVALVVGELSRERDPESDARVPSSPPPPPPSSDRPPPAGSRPNEPPAQGPSAIAGGNLRIIGSNAFVGAFASVGSGVSRRVRLGLVARYAAASADDTLGSAAAKIASGGVSASYRLLTTGSIATDTGPVVEASWIGGSGDGIGARTTSAFGVIGAWSFEARWSVAEPITVALAAEGGYIAPGLELRADDRMVLRIAGPFAGVSLGVGVGF
jgi:hypothetical protein